MHHPQEYTTSIQLLTVPSWQLMVSKVKQGCQQAPLHVSRVKQCVKRGCEKSMGEQCGKAADACCKTKQHAA